VDRKLRRIFTGHIAGFGTRAGVRLVVGRWAQSPFGAFTDVMMQQTDGQRLLLAPNRDIATFVSSTYRFDRVVVGEVTGALGADRLAVSAPGLDVTAHIGGFTRLDRLLRLIPGRLAVAPWWLRVVDPIATRFVAGVHTAGTAGNGRREYYGVRRARAITAVSGTYGGADLGAVAPLSPPVSFGFASAPEAPQIVAVTTTIVEASPA
jgi:hypothetical protein